MLAQDQDHAIDHHFLKICTNGEACRQVNRQWYSFREIYIASVVSYRLASEPPIKHDKTVIVIETQPAGFAAF